MDFNKKKNDAIKNDTDNSNESNFSKDNKIYNRHIQLKTVPEDSEIKTDDKKDKKNFSFNSTDKFYSNSKENTLKNNSHKLVKNDNKIEEDNYSLND